VTSQRQCYQTARGRQHPSSFLRGLQRSAKIRKRPSGYSAAGNWADMLANVAAMRVFEMQYLRQMQMRIKGDLRPPSAAADPPAQVQQSAATGRRKRR